MPAKFELTPARLDFIQVQLANRVSGALIAKDLGISHTTLYKLLKRHKISHSPDPCLICQNTWLPLEMFERLAEEAQEFGVSKAQVVRLALESYLGMKDGKGKGVNAQEAGRGKTWDLGPLPPT